MAKNKWAYWLGLCLFYACGQTTIYQSSISLNGSQWPESTVIDFSFQVKDETQVYDIYLLVKNTPAYPYQNLYITHYLEDGTQQLLHKELKNYVLFESKTGKPLGKGGGKSKHHEFLVTTGHRFSQPGLYTLKLAHFMRTAMLPGIQAIGIKVAPSKPTLK